MLSIKAPRSRKCFRNSKTPGYSVVHMTCFRAVNVDILKKALAKDPSMAHLAFQSPVSPLHLAVGSENTVALEVLLQYWKEQCLGSPLEEFDRDRVDAVPAGTTGSIQKHTQYDTEVRKAKLLSIYDAQIMESKLDLVRTLSASGKLDTKDFYTGTPLHLAAYIGHCNTTKMLLRYGASIDSFDKDMDTPLHIACDKGEISAASLLLESGANASKRDACGRTAAMIVAEKGHEEIVKLIIDRHEDLALTDGHCESLLHCVSSQFLGAFFPSSHVFRVVYSLDTS